MGNHGSRADKLSAMHAALWAPWRMAYLRDLEAKATEAGAGAPTGLPNFLAAYWARPDLDESQHVIHRDARGMVLLNRFPYSNGHLLVALGEPQPSIDRYAPADRAHFWRLMELAMDVCQHALRPQGMNAGINLGAAGGAGLPEHLHGHVVPRWSGDTNFMSVIGEVRTIPDALDRTFALYSSQLPASLARLGLGRG